MIQSDTENGNVVFFQKNARYTGCPRKKFPFCLNLLGNGNIFPGTPWREFINILPGCQLDRAHYWWAVRAGAIICINLTPNTWHPAWTNIDIVDMDKEDDNNVQVVTTSQRHDICKLTSDIKILDHFNLIMFCCKLLQYIRLRLINLVLLSNIYSSNS